MGTAVLWGILILAALGAAAYFVILPRWQRPHQLETLASGLGLKPEPEPKVLGDSGLLASPLLAHDRARCSNVLRGEVRGAEAFVFDYTRGDRRRVPDSVVFFRLRQKRLPAFELHPRESNEARGFTLESHPRFSEIYALTGSDEEAVRKVFKGDVLDFFERGENQSWAVTSTGEWMAVTFWPLGERTQLLHPKEVMGFVEDAKEVLFVLSA
jgi:hypothetical protein